MTVRIYLHRYDRNALSPAGDWYVKEEGTKARWGDAVKFGTDDTGNMALWLEFEDEASAAVFKLREL